MRKILLTSLFLISCSTHNQKPEASTVTVFETKMKPEQAVAKAFDEGRGREQLGLALEALFRTAERALGERGYEAEATTLLAEWPVMRTRYFGKELPEDMGDHSPLSQWLADKYNMIEAALGLQVCKLLHLTDIKVINYTVPVVFHPKASEKWCSETVIQNPTDTCKMEYRRHFAGTAWQRGPMDPFAKDPLHDGLIPVIVYWVAWGACEAATFGTGWVIICTPIGDLAEIVTERYIAPPLSDKLYDRENQL